MEKGKKIDKRHNHDQLNKTFIILYTISTVIAVLALLFGVYYQISTKNNDHADKQQTDIKSTTLSQKLTEDE